MTSSVRPALLLIKKERSVTLVRVAATKHMKFLLPLLILFNGISIRADVTFQQLQVHLEKSSAQELKIATRNSSIFLDRLNRLNLSYKRALEVRASNQDIQLLFMSYINQAEGSLQKQFSSLGADAYQLSDDRLKKMKHVIQSDKPDFKQATVVLDSLQKDLIYFQHRLEKNKNIGDQQ